MRNVHNGVLLSHKEAQHYLISREMDGTGEYYAVRLVSHKSKKSNVLPNMLKPGRKRNIGEIQVQRGETLEE